MEPDGARVSSRPNLLFILADQFRADALGAVSSYASTPHLDRLAEEGVLFRRAYCNSPECVPSRFSFALSRYPHETGVWRNEPATLNSACPNWMQAIAAAGYRTSLIGKTHLHPHSGDLREREPLMHELGIEDVNETAGPRASMTCLSHMTASWQEKGVWDAYRRDFEERFAETPYLVRPSPLPIEDYYDVYVGHHAARYLADYRDERPWCCWVSFGGPHEPWDTPEPYASRFDPALSPPPLPRLAGSATIGGLARRAFDSPERGPAALSEHDVSLMRANYAGGVTLIDDQIGEVLDTLRARKELNNTIVVFTSDHGEMNGDQGLIYKSTFFEPAIRIPLIVRVPPAWPGPKRIVCDIPVGLIDVSATLVDLAGAVVPPSFRGRSLRSTLEGRDGTSRSVVLSEFDHHYCLIGPRWKVEFAPDLSLVAAFDLETDPGEQHNIAAQIADQGYWKGLLGDMLSRTPAGNTTANIERVATA
jgi:choline-sulfatase